jgi:hypothetical protein
MARRDERDDGGLGDAAGEWLWRWAASSPIGCVAVGAAFVALGLYLRYDTSTVAPWVHQTIGTVLAWGGGAILAGGLVWALRRRAPARPAAGPTAPPPPLCPACGVPMRRREPRPGGKAFKPFWGCPNFPTCRQTVEAE